MYWMSLCWTSSPQGTLLTTLHRKYTTFVDSKATPARVLMSFLVSRYSSVPTLDLRPDLHPIPILSHGRAIPTKRGKDRGFSTICCWLALAPASDALRRYLGCFCLLRVLG